MSYFTVEKMNPLIPALGSSPSQGPGELDQVGQFSNPVAGAPRT